MGCPVVLSVPYEKLDISIETLTERPSDIRVIRMCREHLTVLSIVSSEEQLNDLYEALKKWKAAN